MNTLTYSIGETQTWTIGIDRAEHESTALIDPIDLSGAAAELIVRDDAGSAQMTLTAEIGDDPGTFSIRIVPSDVILPPDIYQGHFWIRWPDDEWEHVTTIAVEIREAGK